MDNVNPVIYEGANTLSTTDTDRRLLDHKDAGSLLCINHGSVTDAGDQWSAGGGGAAKGSSLFQPTTEFEEFEVSEIFNIIRNIKDPEYSYTLETLKIVEEQNIHIDTEHSVITVHFTPTVPHCSQATVIGLMIYVKLYQSLPPQFKIDVQIAEGSHNNEAAINKQLLDKERVAAALENPVLLDMINDGIYYNDGAEGGLIDI